MMRMGMYLTCHPMYLYARPKCKDKKRWCRTWAPLIIQISSNVLLNVHTISLSFDSVLLHFSCKTLKRANRTSCHKICRKIEFKRHEFFFLVTLPCNVNSRSSKVCLTSEPQVSPFFFSTLYTHTPNFSSNFKWKPIKSINSELHTLCVHLRSLTILIQFV